jgi:aspartate-semialdehyde dehydrogenase
MLKVGFVGWRGMVGSVLMERMRQEKDFAHIEPAFFSTSNVGGASPKFGGEAGALKDAYDLTALSKLDVIVSCQGGDYTTAVHDKLRANGYKGYWIDAASTLRMRDDTVIILDPVNLDVIREGLQRGIKSYAGGNCTVSLMLMALGGLFKAGLVEWMISMTYQAASGAGAKQMRELVAQMSFIATDAEVAKHLSNPAAEALEIDRAVSAAQRNESIPTENFGYPLAASLLPWIDKPVEAGQSREEWKGYVETNKIMGLNPPVPVDGLCVRVGSMRCHAQAVAFKLTRKVPLDEIEERIRGTNQWVRLIPNTKAESLAELTPAKVSGKLEVPIGRLHPLRMGPDYLTAFTIGDQLLWGAAEPLRRMLAILGERI